MVTIKLNDENNEQAQAAARLLEIDTAAALAIVAEVVEFVSYVDAQVAARHARGGVLPMFAPRTHEFVEAVRPHLPQPVVMGDDVDADGGGE
jgi:hypothetical protein